MFRLFVLTSLLIHGAARTAEETPVFTDVTDAAKITFKHSYGDFHLSNIVEGTGAGGMFFDYNNDGFLDIYIVNGCWLNDVSQNRGRRLRGKLFNRLYRSNGDGTFDDVTEAAGVGDRGFGTGCSSADFDNDGDLDLYVLNYGPNVFYRNNGDGTFTDISKESGLDDSSWSLSSPWFDYDGDGDLDVFVANYLEYDSGKFRDYYPAAGYPGPLSYRGQTDRFFRNNGDGTFTDVTKETGLYNPKGRAMSALVADLDNDGLLDIYVTNDAMENYFYKNTGKKTFEEAALFIGLAYGEGGQGVSSMGPAAGDVDRDGLLDIYIPDMGYGCLLMNRKTHFEDRTSPSRLAVVCGQYTGWGGVLFDYDNDGYLDVFIANGNAHHEYSEEDVLMKNDGTGTFVDIARNSGDYFHRKYVGRGATYGDYDNDGDLDLLVINLNDRARLLRNDGGDRNNWLSVNARLAGHKRLAIGARVTVSAGSLTMIQDVNPVRGYLSQGDPRVYFGLGAAGKADKVHIRWPCGAVKVLRNVKANRHLAIVQEKTKENQ